jgi:hypothetical protein
MESALKDGKIWPLQNELAFLITGQRNILLVDTLVLPANPLRKFLQITNDEAAGVNNIIYVSLGAPAVVNQGIRLNLNGGTYIMNRENLYTGEVHAIVDPLGAPSVLTVTEG